MAKTFNTSQSIPYLQGTNWKNNDFFLFTLDLWMNDDEMVIKEKVWINSFCTYICYLIFNARENRKDKTLSSRSFSCPAYLSLEPTSGTKIVFIWLSESLTLKLFL